MKDSRQTMVGADRAGRLLVLTLLTMTAFAANSILCCQALKTTPIDPATFTVDHEVTPVPYTTCVFALCDPRT